MSEDARSVQQLARADNRGGSCPPVDGQRPARADTCDLSARVENTMGAEPSGDAPGLLGLARDRDHSSLTPYYRDAFCTIYHADCRVVLPHLQAFDLLLADPPYGIGESSAKVATRGRGSPFSKAKAYVRDYGHFDWDKEPVEEWAMFLARRLCKWQIIFGGNFYELPPASCWLIWDKENNECDFADCEMAWTNLPKAVRRIKHLWNGMLRKGREVRYHPTQKPLDVMAWALRQVPAEVTTVLDPWMGSGTTLRACKDAGKLCVGIEREEKWCEIAATRMQQEVLNLAPAVADPAGLQGLLVPDERTNTNSAQSEVSRAGVMP